MPFTIVAGSFHALNYSPDGDTVRFAPERLETLAALGGVPPRLNARNHASLRLEGIDALETHYEGRHQPLALAHEATDVVLEHIGLREVRWDGPRSTVVASEDAAPGYILARATDKFGRIVAFAYPGPPPGEDGASHFLGPEDSAGSASMRLIEAGLAYPTFYSSLFADLRGRMTEATLTARAAGLGVHAVDQTEAGVEVASMQSLTDDAVILPKLFRRLSVYLGSAGTVAGFKDALEANREPVFDLRDENFTHFDTFVEEEGATIRLLRRPEELVFDPMPSRPGGAFRAMLERSFA